MNKTHIFVIAVVLGIAVMLGVFAAGRTARLGAASRSVNQAQIARQQQRLTAAEQALKRALARSAAVTPAVPVRTARTVYVRPAPIIIHKHRSGEGDEGQGGFDD